MTSHCFMSIAVYYLQDVNTGKNRDNGGSCMKTTALAV